ncbi:MAG: cytochrome c biogenesis protein CcdA [Pirellulaceae bacterium]|jgi:cytochrome c biogenesis protein CcdA
MRFLLGILTVSPVVSFVVAKAYHGQHWAIAVATPLFFVGIAFVYYAFVFLWAFVLAAILLPYQWKHSNENVSEQILPPVDPN